MTDIAPIPKGSSTITPFFALDDTEGFADFLIRAFDGNIHFSLRSDGSVLRHAIVNIGNSRVMVSKGAEQFEARPLALHLYVADTDGVYEKAIAAGARSLREPADQFYGARSAGVEDPFGNHWWIATQIEEVSEDELKKREAAVRKGESASADIQKAKDDRAQ